MRRALAVLFTLVAAAPAHGAGWSKPVTLAGAGREVAVSAAGDRVLTAWVQSDGALRTARRTAGGRFEASTLGAPGRLPSSPWAAIRPDGSGVVVWRDRTGSEDLAMLAELRPDGTFAEPITLSDPGRTHLEGPMTVAGDNGDIVVTWSEHAPDVGGELNVIVSPPGEPIPPPVVIAPGGAGPQASVAPDGRIAVTWRASTNSGEDCPLLAAERLPGGDFGAPMPMGKDQQCGAVPLVAYARDGEITAVWDRLTFNDDDIITGNWRPAGGAFGPAQTLSAKGIASLSGFGLRSFDAHPLGGAAALWWMRGKRDRVEVSLRSPGRPFRRPFTAISVRNEDPYANFLWRTPGQGVVVWRAIRRRHAQVLARTISARGKLGRVEVVSSMPPRYDIDYASGFAQLARDGRGAIWAAWIRADGRVQVARRR